MTVLELAALQNHCCDIRLTLARTGASRAYLTCILKRLACHTCVSSFRGAAPAAASAGSVAQLASAAARRRPGRRRAARDSGRTAAMLPSDGQSAWGASLGTACT